MSKLNFFLICSIILVNIYAGSAAPDFNTYGGFGKHGTLGGDVYGGGLGVGHGLGFGEDCSTETSIRLQRCVEDYDESVETFLRRLNYFSRASKDTCCKLYKIRRCLRKSLYEINNCRDVADAMIAGRMKMAFCDGYIETDCYLPIWAIILIVIFSILFIGCLVAGIVYLLRKRQTTT